jgi:hypothetical protein
MDKALDLERNRRSLLLLRPVEGSTQARRAREWCSLPTGGSRRPLTLLGPTPRIGTPPAPLMVNSARRRCPTEWRRSSSRARMRHYEGCSNRQPRGDHTRQDLIDLKSLVLRPAPEGEFGSRRTFRCAALPTFVNRSLIIHLHGAASLPPATTAKSRLGSPMVLQQICQLVFVSAHGVQPEVRNSVVLPLISACGGACLSAGAAVR